MTRTDLHFPSKSTKHSILNRAEPANIFKRLRGARSEEERMLVLSEIFAETRAEYHVQYVIPYLKRLSPTTPKLSPPLPQPLPE
jgi:hypothetical protein